MSDYCYEKVVRYQCTAKDLNLDDIWDIEEKYPDLFDVSEKEFFQIAPTETEYIDFVIESTYGEQCGEFGFSRKLSENELKKFKDIFSKIIPNINDDNFRIVEYCWYNCTEAPDYFDVEEEL